MGMIAVGLAVAVVPVGAADGGRGWYAGAGVGMTQNSDFVDANDDGSLSGISDDDTDTSWSVYGGYNFTPHVGVEASYSDHGETGFSATSDGSGDSWVAGDVATDFEADGVGVAVVGRWPVSDRWTLFARLGVYSWNTTETFTENGFVSKDENSGTDASYGAGFEYDIGKEDDWVIRGEVGGTQVDDDGDSLVSGQVGVLRRF